MLGWNLLLNAKSSLETSAVPFFCRKNNVSLPIATSVGLYMHKKSVSNNFKLIIMLISEGEDHGRLSCIL